MRADQLSDVLFKNQDEAYRQMQVRLLPNIAPDTIIGVRTPVLRGIAKEMEDRYHFLKALPHSCFEENQIHCFLLEREKDFGFVISEIERFLPYVDNWATCDQLRPRCFQKNRKALLPYIRKWIASDEPFTIRFGIGMLMVHFLDDGYDKTLLDPQPDHPESHRKRSRYPGAQERIGRLPAEIKKQTGRSLGSLPVCFSTVVPRFPVRAVPFRPSQCRDL